MPERTGSGLASPDGRTARADRWIQAQREPPPPGFQSGSSPGGFAARASTNSRSREAVQVDERERVDRPLARGGEHLALGAAARGPRDVQARGAPRCRPAGRSCAAPEAARSPRRSRPRAARPAPAVMRSLPSSSANGTQRSAPRSKSSFWIRSSRPSRASTCAQPTSELSSSTAPNAQHERVELRDARPVPERGLAAVPAARVDPRQPHRLVALARAHRATGSRGPRSSRAITSRWISLVPS